MFMDEIKEKLKLDDVLCPYSVTVLGNYAVAVDGVKNVVLSASTEVRIRVKGGIISILGNELNVTEIGADGVYVRGKINSLVFE